MHNMHSLSLLLKLKLQVLNAGVNFFFQKVVFSLELYCKGHGILPLTKKTKKALDGIGYWKEVLSVILLTE